MPISYTLWTNLDARYTRTYRAGDRLVRGFSGSVESEPEDAPDQIWARHQRDDRPDGQMAPSLSIGDVIELEETAVSVADIGFAPVAIDASDRIVDRTWLEVTREA